MLTALAWLLARSAEAPWAVWTDQNKDIQHEQDNPHRRGGPLSDPAGRLQRSYAAGLRDRRVHRPGNAAAAEKFRCHPG
ncbi:conserved protein of unknown function [Ectopseudomonas oleovorans]|uniref:Uncharacterized protein n=1 Tax=Ectopseudomonas oleovorans TaxID=301 RepID=A0A653B2W7_ECTOL|nr:conserved protein of unknown function [Pseudomonas oleovorans]